MRPLLFTCLNAADASLNEASQAIDASQLFSVSLQAESTGTSTGTIKIQFSNDRVDPSNPPGAPTNWTDVTSASVSVAGAGVVAIQKIDLCYQWIRVTFTAGNAQSGALTVNMKALGA